MSPPCVRSATTLHWEPPFEPPIGKKPRTMNVFITGCGGYIGSTLAEQLLGAGHTVTGYDRWFFGRSLMADLAENQHFRMVTGDIRDISPNDLEGHDIVFDLAALSNDPSGDLNPEWTSQINHIGRVRVAKAAKQAGVERYILASSCSVYGQGKSEFLDESSIPRPITTYAKSNLAAELDILSLSGATFSACSARQATVFGLSRRMRFDLVINLMTVNAFEQGLIFISGGGQQWRPIVHVRDTSDALIKLAFAEAAQVAGEVFNVGTSNMQVLDIAQAVSANLPFPVDLQVLSDTPDQRDYHVSFEKIRTRLGWEGRRSAAEGVREIYRALKNDQTSFEARTQTVNWYKRLMANGEFDALMIAPG